MSYFIVKFVCAAGRPAALLSAGPPDFAGLPTQNTHSIKKEVCSYFFIVIVCKFNIRFIH